MGNKTRVLVIGLPALVLLLYCAMALPGKPQFQFVVASKSVLSQPHDIVLSPNGDRLYVADNGNDRIAVLDALTLKLHGEFAKGDVSEPHDVVFDTSGRLLVADTGNSRIAIYEVAEGGGRLVGELRERIRRPEGVAVHPDGRVFATGSASNNLVVYHDGQVTAERGGFSSPHDVEFDRNGMAWVADTNNNRMVRLSERHEAAHVLSGREYDFRGPRYMDFDDANRIYVADKYNNSIKVIAPEGGIVQVIGRNKSGQGPDLFDRPEGVEIRGDDIWLSDTYNDRVVRYKRNRERY